uniref:Uncharacterized protein n=1 Tax=viral metagenome TaxID=1070528 RepID=A0A6C0LES8_9ZZZZ
MSYFTFSITKIDCDFYNIELEFIKRTQTNANERKRTQTNANERKRTQTNANERKRTQ